MNKVITRFPPSPTGNLHMGSARTALFNYLFAKHFNGQMRLRMEDTDKERSKKEFEENILQGLKWLEINYDGELWRQSERTEVYKNELKKLIDAGLAYEAEESKDANGKVIRFKNPNKKVVFNDLIRGQIEVDTTDLGDFVIARNIDNPLYHLTVVVDDAQMEVTHIIRGEDGISNTPRQILLQEALGYSTPQYAHIPFILGPDKSKLSKRHGAKSVSEYEKDGYLKDAIINFLAMLGWRSKSDDEKEIWTLEELVKDFDIAGIQKSGAVFNEEKLKWINKEHLKKLPDDKFWEDMLEFAPDALREKFENTTVKEALLDDVRERISVYSEIGELTKNGEYDWLLNKDIEINPEELVWKKSNAEDTKKHLQKVHDILCDPKIDEFTKERVEGLIMPYAEAEGKGDVLWPMRYALSGQKRSPNPFILSSALGKEKTCERIISAINTLQ